MPLYMADLHIHTILSPCADYMMVPSLIVEKSLQAGLDIIAITDHNSVANVPAVIEAAKDKGLYVVPGMEVESAEEVHLITIFDNFEQANLWQKRVFDSLPYVLNRRVSPGPRLRAVWTCGFRKKDAFIIL